MTREEVDELKRHLAALPLSECHTDEDRQVSWDSTFFLIGKIRTLIEVADQSICIEAKLNIATDALNSLACWDDTSANAKLESTGSYGSFDDPNSARVSREALAQIEATP